MIEKGDYDPRTDKANLVAEKSYSWQGTITRIEDGGAIVSWDERRGLKSGSELWYRLEDLRQLCEQLQHASVKFPRFDCNLILDLLLRL